MVLIEGTDVLQSQVSGESILKPPPFLAFYGGTFSDTVYVYRCTSCVMLP